MDDVGMNQQRLELGTKNQRALRRQGVVEGFFAHPVSRQQKGTTARVPNREAEHPSEVLDARRPIFFVRMDDHFGVGIGEKAMSSLPEIALKLTIVVNLPVERDRDAAVFT